MRTVNVARDFSRYPMGRYKKNGDVSGEEFREKFLVPALKDKQKLVIELDGTIGYGSSFLEEAFGGLLRELNCTPELVLELIELVTEDESLKIEIREYIQNAGKIAE